MEETQRCLQAYILTGVRRIANALKVYQKSAAVRCLLYIQLEPRDPMASQVMQILRIPRKPVKRFESGSPRGVT